MIGIEQPNKEVYSRAEIQNISALGDIFRQIRARLIREGVSIEDERRKLLLESNNEPMVKYKKYDAQRTKRKTIQK